MTRGFLIDMADIDLGLPSVKDSEVSSAADAEGNIILQKNYFILFVHEHLIIRNILYVLLLIKKSVRSFLQNI